MIFWIYNDNGGPHRNTNGQAMRMEVQAMAFGFQTSDEINDMSFYRYKLINRALSSIDSTFFGMWVDADLGCYLDDHIGCDTSRSLAIVYNETAVDGLGGCGGTPSYGPNVPLLGVDYFRGPLDEFGNELGMSSFVYYNNCGGPDKCDPSLPSEYYNYLSGTWKDGSPYVDCGDGYPAAGTTCNTINYVFPTPPRNQNGWSMCTGGVVGNDIRTLQASGPFLLVPGATNELIIGVVWVPDVPHPCPQLTKLLAADDKAQQLFDGCFDIIDGPDAPDVDIIELDQKLVLALSNAISSNNYNEGYEEVDIAQNPRSNDSLYVFEGYQVFQLANSGVSVGDLDDPEKARLVFQVDKENGIDKIYNWNIYDDVDLPGQQIYTPELEVEGENQGIRHTFEITDDQFADGASRLINHKKYYYTAVAYGHNNYDTFDIATLAGQQRVYLPGRRNIKTYVGIPRINTPEYYGTVLMADYGDGPAVKRLDGVGTGYNFLEVTDEERLQIARNNVENEIDYDLGGGPINVFVYDPLRVKPGTYTFAILDEDLSNTQLDDSLVWVIDNGPGGILSGPIYSSTTINEFSEQLIPELGLSVSIEQANTPGVYDPTTEVPLAPNNGNIGGAVEYPNGGTAWFAALSNGQGPGGGGVNFDFMQTRVGQNNYRFAAGTVNDGVPVDPNQDFANLANGYFYPYTTLYAQPGSATKTPVWLGSGTFGARSTGNNDMTALRSVDIVFTDNRDLWSKCIVVETGNRFNTSDDGLSFEYSGDKHMAKRGDASVDKFGNPIAGTGFGYFPGYAIDVETGERLNIFFGENSTLSTFPGGENGADMLWNPSGDFFLNALPGGFSTYSNIYLGGQHNIYVHNSVYDECATVDAAMGTGSNVSLLNVYKETQWASMPFLGQGAEMKSYADGFIPSELHIKLRVSNPYEYKLATGTNPYAAGYPYYSFTLDGLATQIEQPEVAESALDLINVVPNPYYAYSSYETTPFRNIVKITNLPPDCEVTIYSLDGKFIRRFNRNEVPSSDPITGGERQIVTSLEWDLKNSAGIQVASGVYIIHVDVPGVGEKTIKWFGVGRQFDASGL